MHQQKIKQFIISKIKHLPTLPEIVQKVSTLVQNENTSVKDLCTLISYDQAISLRLLKVANSAYYGFLREVSTIQHAVVVLGFDEVKRLSLGIAVFNSLKMIDDQTSLKWVDFWKHSIGCSLAARLICKRMPINSEMASTASLLHDIGKLVLTNCFNQGYSSILLKAEKEKANLADVEKEMLGFTHPEVGRWLGERWKLPPSLTFPIAYHHAVNEVESSYLPLTSIVHLADIVCRKLGIENSGNHYVPFLQSTATETLHLHEEDCISIIEELKNEEEKVYAFLNSIR